MRKISEFIMRREKIKKIEEKSKKIMQKTDTKKRFTGSNGANDDGKKFFRQNIFVRCCLAVKHIFSSKALV
jgi:hypothetical protein